MGLEGWNAGFATPLFSQGSLQNIVSQLCFLLLFSVFVCLSSYAHACVCCAHNATEGRNAPNINQHHLRRRRVEQTERRCGDAASPATAVCVSLSCTSCMCSACVPVDANADAMLMLILLQRLQDWSFVHPWHAIPCPQSPCPQSRLSSPANSGNRDTTDRRRSARTRLNSQSIGQGETSRAVLP